MTGCSLTGVGGGARLGADSGSSGWLSRIGTSIAPLEGRRDSYGAATLRFKHAFAENGVAALGPVWIITTE